MLSYFYTVLAADRFPGAPPFFPIYRSTFDAPPQDPPRPSAVFPLTWESVWRMGIKTVFFDGESMRYFGKDGQEFVLREISFAKDA